MRAIIIEDEPRAVSYLRDTLADHCPDVHVEAVAGTVTTALQALREKQPDLVFLDIKLGGGKGFEILEKLGMYDFEVIYTTAHFADRDIAVHTHRFSAAALLAKPYTSSELKDAVDKARRTFRRKLAAQSVDIGKRQEHQRIVLRNLGESFLLALKDIVYCESDRSQVYFYTRTGGRKTVGKSLTECEALLHGNGFIRIHNSYLVNTLCIRSYAPGRKGGAVFLDDGTELEISETYRDAFKKWLGGSNLNFDK